MTVQDKIDLTLRLPFEGAGVEFVIEVGETDSGTTFGLTVESLDSGDRVPFTSPPSPVLADWVRGYTRWLFRARVSASYDEDSISGTFAPDLTSEQTPRGRPARLRHDQAEVRAIHGFGSGLVVVPFSLCMPCQHQLVAGRF